MPDFPELTLIIVVLAIVFGARRFTQLGQRVGRWLDRVGDRKGSAGRERPHRPGPSNTEP